MVKNREKDLGKDATATDKSKSNKDGSGRGGGGGGVSNSNAKNKLNPDSTAGTIRQSLVQIYDSKKKRCEEAVKVTLKFNQKPTAGFDRIKTDPINSKEDDNDCVRKGFVVFVLLFDLQYQ